MADVTHILDAPALRAQGNLTSARLAIEHPGQPGMETSYRLKPLVQAIKQAALDGFQDEPELLSMGRRAMASEAETVARRFSAKTA